MPPIETSPLSLLMLLNRNSWQAIDPAADWLSQTLTFTSTNTVCTLFLASLCFRYTSSCHALKHNKFCISLTSFCFKQDK